MTTIPHVIRDSSSGQIDLCGEVARVHPASLESVARVLASPVGDDDGRSEYLWVRLPNGDLILGVFPKGDTYIDVESDSAYPGTAEVVMKPAKDIREGDLVDLEGDRYADPHLLQPNLELEYALVSSVTDETTAIAIGFEGFDVVGFPPDHLLSVKVAA